MARGQKKGFKHSDVSKEKMREASIKRGARPPQLTTEQRKMNAVKSGCIPPSRLGTKHSIVTRLKMRESAQRGNKNVNWKGGISNENRLLRKSSKFKEWREAVFMRDNFTCQKYGLKGVVLHPHHILNFGEYPELRFNVDNGITLSKKAHQEFHVKYGRKHNNREQLFEFLSTGQ